MTAFQLVTGLSFVLFLTTHLTQATLDWQCSNRYCFGSDHVFKNVYSIEYADNMCKQIDSNSWLMEIYDKSVEEELNSYLATRPKLKNKPLLMNLQRKGGEWRWLDHTKFDAKTSDKRNKVKLFNSDPFTTIRYLPYRGIYGNTYVTTRLANYICSIKGSCSKHGFVGSTKTLTYKDQCYASFTEKGDELNWFQAENSCYKKGSSLAVFSHFSARELQNVFRRFIRPNLNYWVGLVKHTWEWRHNSASVSNYTNWYQGFPHPVLLNLRSETVYTSFDSSNGSIWTDAHTPPSSPIVCMKDNVQKRETLTAKASVPSTSNPRFQRSVNTVTRVYVPTSGTTIAPKHLNTALYKNV